jgi:hypothetical protein
LKDLEEMGGRNGWKKWVEEMGGRNGWKKWVEEMVEEEWMEEMGEWRNQKYALYFHPSLSKTASHR